MIFKEQPGHHVDPFMDNQEFVGPPLSKDSLNLSGESCFANKADSYQTADAATNMLSDKDPLLPSSSTPFRLELQADGTEQCEISTTEVLNLDAVGDVITSVDEHRVSDLQESSQNSSNSEPLPTQTNRKSPRLHTPVAIEETKEDENKDQSPKIIHPTSKEFKKTWGFRQTTIAKRDNAVDAENSDTALSESSDQLSSLRRSRRQTQRSARVQEFISAAQKRYRRMTDFEGGEFGSIAACEAGTGSDGSAEIDEKPIGLLNLGSGNTEAMNEVANSDEDNSTNSDSDELTLKELQNQLRKRRDQEQSGSPQSKQKVQEKSTEENKVKNESKSLGTTKTKKQIIIPTKKGAKSEKESTSQSGAPSESEDEGSVAQSDNGYNDPDKLYCICRQPHSNRFMICCDRCEEWFHGDCVGITMARGRLLERNGEDYICPDCSPSPKDSDTTEMKPGQQESKPVRVGTDEQNAAAGKRDGSTTADQGIKGRIEKAANPSGKKKIKIFKLAVNVAAVPKCIGPGCGNLASTDSVYCSNNCILKHAAATMKSLSQAKDQKQKPKEKGKSKPEKLTSSKSSAEASLKPLTAGPHKSEELNTMEMPTKKSVVLVHKNPMPSLKETVSSTGAGTWTIDHNYNAAKPEKNVISTSVFYESFQQEGSADKRTNSASVDEQPNASVQATSSKPSITTVKQSVNTVEHRAVTKRPISATQQLAVSKHKALSKQTILSKLQVSSKYPILSKQQSSYRIPMKHSAPTAKQSVHLSEQSLAKRSGDKQQSNPVVKNTNQLSNSQIRQNIRRSLKEILCKRVNDCDDLRVTEDTIGKIAVNVEKELFTLFQDTHSKYKSRYRSIMFNLKNPRNQGLFRRVVREEIVPFHLVRMSPEEIESKELAVWGEQESRTAQERLQRETKGTASRAANTHEVDMEEAPPMSDADEQEDAHPTQKTNLPLPDIFNSMLKDTTNEHRAHLFDLNCRICTGKVQVSDDEPVPKKPKVIARKPEPKAKPRANVRQQQEQDQRTLTASPPSEQPATTQEMTPLSKASEGLPTTNVVTTQLASKPVRSSFMSPVNNPTWAAVANPPSTIVVSSLSVPKTIFSSSTPTAVSGTVRTVKKGEEDLPKSILTSAVPKSILSKPSGTPEQKYRVSTARVSESKTQVELDTSLFLSHLDAIWKGFINMHGVAKFVTKAFPVSGSIDYLVEDLPDTIHIGGRISPHTVWDYVGKLKSSLSKEVCLIRFHPATEEEEVTYISLYSYFNSRGRFGVVANNARHIKDLYLIPLAANDPIPSKLLPFEGPGLEKSRPNLILGLVIRQKAKRRQQDLEPASLPESEKPEATSSEEKRSRLSVAEEMEVQRYTASMVRESKLAKPHALPGEPDASTPPQVSPPAELRGESVPPLAKVHNASTAAPTQPPAGANSTAAPGGSASKVANPLQHILQTLFGGKKTFDKAKDSPDSAGSTPEPEAGASSTPLIDPIVQQFGQLKEDKAEPEVEDDDNRPYDPEEEYKPEAEKVYDLEDAYDPADETILEEAMVTVVGGAVPTMDSKNNGAAPDLYLPPLSVSSSIQEQQKMLDTLNKQIEEQTRQLEEQEEALRQQRAAVGVSMACFSVSDALMSPPPKSSHKSDPFDMSEAAKGQLPGPESTPSSSAGPSQVIDQRRDPRQAAVRRAIPNQLPGARKEVLGESAPAPADQLLAPTYSSPSIQVAAPTVGARLLQEPAAPAPQTGGDVPAPGGISVQPPVSLETMPAPVCAPQTLALVDQVQVVQPPTKGLLPTPILPPLLGPTFANAGCFPSPVRGPQSFGNKQDNFHSSAMQQAMGPYPNFQHPNNQPDFNRETRPPFQQQKPPSHFTRGAPGPRYRFQGQQHLGYGNQPPHPVGNHSPSPHEPPPVQPGSAQLPETEGQRPGAAQSRQTTARDRERPRGHRERSRDRQECPPSESRYGPERGDARHPAERFRRGADDRRRDRERDYGRPWERDRDREWDRSKERDRSRNREREHERDRERYRRRDRERERSRDRERGRERETDRGKESKGDECKKAASEPSAPNNIKPES
ncbi:death-inducer obliterator 1 isoform X1 [Amblyraja radiata]|uniref:death-inducer obliterator 1 isoform X1 n=2 Tax=Amblyraja radiata TaxID=386614 RepID=UPI0014030AEF|nr:death-inducer obliterator 1 isoform X1 [Amblyraja radiata]XP_032897586.1 death-inducer obliterator 1 isoform X1 [Amblyraja radiata]XP_032897587.1 death-inducer obliterator 1 isoform X1 [Amblyraja radiata]